MRMGMRRGGVYVNVVSLKKVVVHSVPLSLTPTTTTGTGGEQGQMVIMDDDDYDDDGGISDRNGNVGPMANIGNLGLGDGVKLLQNARDACSSSCCISTK